MALVQSILDQSAYYRKLKIELDSEKNIENELVQVRAHRQELENQIRIKKAEIIALEENSKKEYRDVRDMRHLSIRSAAATLSGKKKEKKAKKEAKYQLAFENEQRSKRELDKLTASYQALLLKEETLSRQRSQFKDGRSKFESLLEQIFVSEDPDFPSEPRLKAELVNYKEQKRLANRDNERFREAENALAKALVDVKKAIRLIDEVVHYVPFELFAGPIIDEEQVTYLEAARKRTWEVQRLLNKARTVLPEIPYPQTLDVVTNNPLLQMHLNANYIDSAWRGKIILVVLTKKTKISIKLSFHQFIAKATQCFGLLATVYKNTQNSINWVKQYKEYAQGALIRLEKAVEDVKKSLFAERQRIIETVLYNYNNLDQTTAARAAEPSTLAAPIPDILSSSYQNEISDLPPPPMYEAPTVPSDGQHQQHQQSIDHPEHQQNQHLPVIPQDMTPLSSFSNLSISDPIAETASSSLSPVANRHDYNNTNSTRHIYSPDTNVSTSFTLDNITPTILSTTTSTNLPDSQHPPAFPQPPTPPSHYVNLDTSNISSNNNEQYVSHNINNPFRSQQVERQ
ncbi:hypothetical protein BDF20DRAFT_284890 [Mycotypha africana]|uniref:uncharacterized protein n=1 Tax=Mycotypha africana TaxID=64632 RepID=UPI002301395D|nr:uncharacterized protein BDF20DRAFT_284890 [Mycotypha africana]KAI8987713.1 hypothetical protein BDF20DRAFT_284890 [Mycotypha africana]